MLVAQAAWQNEHVPFLKSQTKQTNKNGRISLMAFSNLPFRLVANYAISCVEKKLVKPQVHSIASYPGISQEGFSITIEVDSR